MVKQGIQKLKFNQQLKKSEGSKTPKAELTISVNGVTIQEPKSKKVLHEYPLHKISYCADDKAEKRFFSFIAKEGDSSRHTCFVFVSDKLVSLGQHGQHNNSATFSSFTCFVVWLARKLQFSIHPIDWFSRSLAKSYTHAFHC